MRELKVLKEALLIIGIITFVIFITYNIYLDKKAIKKFTEIEYSGVIMKIRLNDGMRGIPDINLNGKWHIMDLDESKIIHYIKIGDSIVKKSGNVEIKVYRKDSLGTWQVKVFK